MGANNYRGEISRISDDIFINYALGLPDTGSASTSGYFMKDVGNPPIRYSHFTVQRGASSPSVQTTVVNKIDPSTGTKMDPLATVQWSSNGSTDLCLGLITGYNPPSDLPPGWAQLEPPYYPCYISMASVSQPGMDKEPSTGKMELHRNRIPELPSAILTIHLPKGVPIDNLKPFLYRHKHSDGNAPPQPEEVDYTFNSSRDGIVIGDTPSKSLLMGLYVVAMPVAANSASSAQSPYRGV